MQGKLGSHIKPTYKLSNLQPGDIMLSTVPNNPISTAIRLAINAPFSHAAIFWRNLTFLEAGSAGICNYNILIRAIGNKDNVRVLRLKPSSGGADKARLAADAASRYMGREYWIEGAVASPLRTGISNPEGRLYCSHFVAQAYFDIGVQLCNTAEPNCVTPKDILDSEILFDVTDEILYVATTVEMSREMILIDGPTVSTPHVDLREATNAIMIDVRSLYAHYGLAVPKTLHHAMAILVTEQDLDTRKEVDDEFASLLLKAQYELLAEKMISDVGENVGWDEQFLLEVPLENLKATIRTHTRILADWTESNAERRRGIDQANEEYGLF